MAFSIAGSTGVLGTTVGYTSLVSGSGSTISGAGGAYTLAGLPVDTYTITPVQTGYSFAPIDQVEQIGNVIVASDTFTIGDSNFTTQAGSWVFGLGSATPGGAGNNIAYWSGAGTFTNDQWATATGAGSSFSGVVLQCDGTNWYDLAYSPSGSGWFLRKNGSNLATGSSSILTGSHTYTLTLVAGVLTAYLDGSPISGATATDATPLTGGVPGLFGFGPGSIYSDFVAGNVVGNISGVNFTAKIAYNNHRSK